jgi:anti-sigma B factor antagonist
MDYQDGFEIEVHRPAAKVVLLAVRGEVDVCTSLGLMEAIVEAFSEHPEVIAVDLSELQYMDSAGVRVLIQSACHIEDGGVRFSVILPSEHRLAQLPQLIGLHRLLGVYGSREDALGPWLDEAGELPTGA